MKIRKKSNYRINTGWFMLIFILFAALVLSGSCTKVKIYKVGILSSYAPMNVIADGFKTGMTELGYVEGKNITYDFQTRDNDPEGEKQVIKKFITDKVDLIFTFPSGASVTANDLVNGTKMPVVFAMAGIEGTLPIEKINNPGGNLSGVRFPGPDNVIKHFELLLEIKPQIKTIWVTYDMSYPNTNVMLEALRPAATARNITLLEAPGKVPEDVQAALDILTASGDYKKIDAILLLPEALSLSQGGLDVIMKFANQYKIPVGAGIPYMMEAGVLFCFLPDNAEMGKLAAPVADKVFKGTPVGSIPIITPENYLFLNNKIAKELGLTLPESLVKMAVQVMN